MAKTREQYNDYMREYMLARYHARRVESYEILGGRCGICGTTEDLQIDHIDPALKTMDVAKLWSVNRTRYLEELEVCQLLCGLHHREKTRREQSVEHGGGVSGKKNCKCDLCKLKKNEYLRNWRAINGRRKGTVKPDGGML